MKDEKDIAFMKRAIALAEEAALIKKCGGPFGAVIVKEGEIVAEGWNQVIETNDPTMHAEMDAIKKASRALKNFKLDGCTLYTSGESCPMCLAACYWAGIKKIFYASKVEDALKYGDFDDAFIYEELALSPEQRKIVSMPLLREESLGMWEKYAKLIDRIPY